MVPSLTMEDYRLTFWGMGYDSACYIMVDNESLDLKVEQIM